MVICKYTNCKRKKKEENRKGVSKSVKITRKKYFFLDLKKNYFKRGIKRKVMKYNSGFASFYFISAFFFRKKKIKNCFAKIH